MDWNDRAHAARLYCFLASWTLEPAIVTRLVETAACVLAGEALPTCDEVAVLELEGN